MYELSSISYNKKSITQLSKMKGGFEHRIVKLKIRVKEKIIDTFATLSTIDKRIIRIYCLPLGILLFRMLLSSIYCAI